jgi:hypothetical protein
MYCFDIKLVMNMPFQKRAQKTRSWRIVVRTDTDIWDAASTAGNRGKDGAFFGRSRALARGLSAAAAEGRKRGETGGNLAKNG